MKYPDGSEISIGDVIWWNEGSNKGMVAVILESDNDFESFGIGIPGKESDEQLRIYGPSQKGIFICTNPDKDEITADVFCPEEDFIDEGIGLLFA